GFFVDRDLIDCPESPVCGAFDSRNETIPSTLVRVQCERMLLFLRKDDYQQAARLRFWILGESVGPGKKKQKNKKRQRKRLSISHPITPTFNVLVLDRILY